MVTVWRVALDAPVAEAAFDVLDAEERARAQRFRDPRHARRWLVSHLALRQLLGAALGCDPRDVAFTRDAQGKPHLATGGPPFNLSHADAMALVGIGAGAPLGVDVERKAPLDDLWDIASSHFAADECAALRAVEASARLDAFYRLWTRKEAYVKATGIGVGPALARFAVTLTPTSARLLRADDDPEAVARWTLRDIPVPEDYVGALAVGEPSARVALRDWSPHRG